MNAVSLHELFNRTVVALQQGRPADAVAMCDEILEQAPGTPEVHHLAGLALTALGRAREAIGHLENAIRARPSDPAILSAMAAAWIVRAEPARAIDYYRAALEADGGFHDALVGLTLACQQDGRLREAHEVGRTASQLHPSSARVWQALALVELELGQLAKAAADFDRAIQLAPQDLKIALGRAQVESDRGGDAGPYYLRASQLSPDDPQVVLGLARTEVLRGDIAAALHRLEQRLRHNPLWIEGHQALARLKWQQGDKSHSTDSLDDALAKNPGSWDLHSARIQLLQASQRWQESLIAIDETRSRFGKSDAHQAVLTQMEIVSRDEAGDHRFAAEQLERIDLDQTSLNFRLAAARHWLRTGKIERAATFLEAIAAPDGHGAAWAYLSAAWRALGDERWQWLEGDDRFVRASDLAEIEDIGELAATLRGLHTTQSNPFDQSVRGGTQTDGQLLGREHPSVLSLRAALDQAIQAYVDGLPPPDAAHPLLSKERNGFRLSGSWSVRLTDSGHHISHIHPDGWISSAFYAAVPGFESDEQGILVLGEPPPELGLSLGPVQTIKPRPGRLALFPSYMWHGTRPFRRGERLTVAFDVVPLR